MLGTGNLDFGEDECFSRVWIDSPPPIDHHQGLAKRTLLSDMTQKQEIIGLGHQILLLAWSIELLCVTYFWSLLFPIKVEVGKRNRYREPSSVHYVAIIL